LVQHLFVDPEEKVFVEYINDVAYCDQCTDPDSVYIFLAGGDGVHVAVFEISADDKLILDEIEGAGYSAALLKVPQFGDCVSYVADESHIDGTLEPYDWYKKLVLIGAQTHGFPATYLNRIDLVGTCRDPDSDRRKEQWASIQHIESNGKGL
jgi:hypothetical protein